MPNKTKAERMRENEETIKKLEEKIKGKTQNKAKEVLSGAFEGYKVRQQQKQNEELRNSLKEQNKRFSGLLGNPEVDKMFDMLDKGETFSWLNDLSF